MFDNFSFHTALPYRVHAVVDDIAAASQLQASSCPAIDATGRLAYAIRVGRGDGARSWPGGA